MSKIIKKADIVLLVILIIAGIALSVFSVTSGRTGSKVVISVDGEVYGTYNISKNQTVVVEHDGHTNKVTIKDGNVQMTYSDCKNQICVHEGSISKTSQSIVCLPNRVVVEIQGGEGEFDAVSN